MTKHMTDLNGPLMTKRFRRQLQHEIRTKVGSMLGQRRRRWPTIVPTFGNVKFSPGTDKKLFILECSSTFHTTHRCLLDLIRNDKEETIASRSISPHDYHLFQSDHCHRSTLRQKYFNGTTR